MLFSNLLLPLATLSLTPALAAHVPRGPKRLHHNHLALRSPSSSSSSSSSSYSTSARNSTSRPNFDSKVKAKRLVRRKRSCAPAQVPLGANTSTTTTTIGGAAWAKPSGSATVSDTEVDTASTTTTSTASSAASSTASQGGSGSSWVLAESWQGSDFFSHWDFWSWDDPTHGTVDYQTEQACWDQGLIRINDQGHAIMDVDKSDNVQGRGRKSVRVHGKRIFTGGLVLMDSYHMPTGCGTWPAWWQNGPDWPTGGEIDILEGVNTFGQNQVSLHTGSGCKMPSSLNDNQRGTLTSGNFDAYNCGSADTGNQGCGVRDQVHDNSYGAGFNTNRGGVYALEWAKSGIKIWFFPRDQIPSDITADQPNPDSWSTPLANFPADDCDPYKFFYDHFSIFDTTFCGDWAGNVWDQAGFAGQDKSCKDMTGYATCDAYVRANGAAFSEAYWEVGYVKYFNSTSLV